MEKGIYISLRIDGEGWNKGAPLIHVAESFVEFNKLLESSWLAINKKSRMSRLSRKEFQLLTQEFRKGSVVGDFYLYIDLAQGILPLVSVVTPSQIWDITRYGLELLKILSSMKKRGIQPNISESAGINISVKGDNNIVVCNPIVVAAEKGYPHYRKIAEKISGGDLKTFSASSNGEFRLSLDSESSSLILPFTSISERALKLNGNLIEFNKISGAGRVTIFSGQSVPNGTYRLIANYLEEDRKEIIESMVEKEITFFGRVRTEMRPIGEDKIVEILLEQLIKK